MRRLIFVLLALGGILVWVMMLAMPDDGTLPSAAVVRAPRAIEPPPNEPAPAEVSFLDLETAVEFAEPAPEARTVAVTAVAVESSFIVFGRIVDERDTPITGAKVQLYGAWPSILGVPLLPGSNRTRGFESRSNRLGLFRFEVPPLPARSGIIVEAGPYHSVLQLPFAPLNARQLRQQREAGERDIGDLRLAVTGSIVGRVFDEGGRNVAGVEVTTNGKSARTGVDGTYRLQHIPVGHRSVTAMRSGYLLEAPRTVLVEGGADTASVDFTMVTAPTISGRVTDVHGAPLALVKVSAQHVMGRTPAVSARTDADGRFTLPLFQNAPHTVSAQLRGYRTWGGHGQGAAHVAAGSDNLAFALLQQPARAGRPQRGGAANRRAPR